MENVAFLIPLSLSALMLLILKKERGMFELYHKNKKARSAALKMTNQSTAQAVKKLNNYFF